jgi:predicted metal-dependent HD superfamily phosphohydrolase
VERREQGFVDAVATLGGDRGPRARAAAEDLARRWSGAERGYHDTEHLDEVLARLHDLDAASPAAVLAAWFHDAVYRGRPGRDERDSADLAVAVLGDLGVAADAARRVGDLVLVTTDHVPGPDDDEAAALCDADLAVLASDPERYRRYADGVRREYRRVPGPLFRRGRAEVLRRLLARAQDPAHPDGPLFRTPRARERWTTAAAANLEEELAHLS